MREGRLIGIGLAHAMKGTGRGPFESGVVRVAPSGRVTVFTGAAAMGQGLKTALAQICARELGLAPADVQVIAGDTAVVPVGLGGFASRQLVTAGSSVLMAARAVAAKAKKLASHVLEVAEHDLELADGVLHVAGAPQLSVRLGELARILQGAPGYPFPPGMEPGLAGVVVISAPTRSPTPMPAMPPKSRSMPKPARFASCAMWRCRIPASWSIR